MNLLEHSGFPNRWMRSIFFYLSDVRFSILINGSPCFIESFGGLREGNSFVSFINFFGHGSSWKNVG